MIRLNELCSLIFYLGVAVLCLAVDYFADNAVLFFIGFVAGIVTFTHLAIICVRIFFGNDKYNIDA